MHVRVVISLSSYSSSSFASLPSAKHLLINLAFDLDGINTKLFWRAIIEATLFRLAESKVCRSQHLSILTEAHYIAHEWVIGQ